MELKNFKAPFESVKNKVAFSFVGSNHFTSKFSILFTIFLTHQWYVSSFIFFILLTTKFLILLLLQEQHL